MNSITIEWTPPITDGGKPINTYKIYIDDGVGGSLTYLATLFDLSTLEYTAEGLINGRQYNFAVSAINDVDESELSHDTPILSATAPGAPTELITVIQTSS